MVIESIWHLPESTPYQIDARMEVIGTQGALYINCGEAGLEIHDDAGNRRPDTLYWPYVNGQRFGILRPNSATSPIAQRRAGARTASRPRNRERPSRCWPPPRSRPARGTLFTSDRSLHPMQFDHVGIITTEKHDDEIYVPATKVWVTDFRKNPYHIEWLRYEPDTPVTGPVRHLPHVAFRVDSIQEAAKGLKVLLEPFDAGLATVGFYQTPDGGIVEFMEYPPEQR